MDFGALNVSIEYFVDRKCLPDWKLDPEVIAFHNLMYVYKGECAFYINHTLYHLNGGDIVYAPQGIIRQANTNPHDLMHCYSVCFKADCKASDIPDLKLPPVIRAGFDTLLIQYFQELNQTWLEKDEGYMMKCRGLLMLILHRVSRISVGQSLNHSPEDPRIERSKQYIANHILKKITLNELADVAGLNPVYFGMLFKKTTGYTVKEYINLLRIRKSKDLLDSGEYSVKETAYLCGYNDIYYFSKLFRKLTNLPPSSYRKKPMQSNKES